MRPVKRYEQIELVIPAGATQTRFNFPDIPQLRSDVTKAILIRALETFSVESIPVDFNGNAVATFASIQKASLTLYVDGVESIFRIPLVKLLNTYGDGTAILWTNELNQFENLEVDWTKSYISSPIPFAIGTQFAFVIGVSYKRVNPVDWANLKAAMGLEGSCGQLTM